MIPTSIARYFSSVQESSNCSKNFFSHPASRTMDTSETQNSSCNQINKDKITQKGQSSRLMDPPNLVRLDSISVCSLTGSPRPSPRSPRTSNLSSKSNTSKNKKFKRYLDFSNKHNNQLYRFEIIYVSFDIIYLCRRFCRKDTTSTSSPCSYTEKTECHPKYLESTVKYEEVIQNKLVSFITSNIFILL